MVMLAPLLTALLPSVVSGIGSFFGRRSANKANRDESGLNRSFQERMSSTAYQRSVKDLEAAGMNPALAYQQGGASSPGGSMAASQESELGEGVSSALAVKTATEQYKLLRAQTAKTKQEGRNVQTEGQALERENIRGQTQFGYYFNGDGTPTAKMKELLQTEHLNGNARVFVHSLILTPQLTTVVYLSFFLGLHLPTSHELNNHRQKLLDS